MKTLTLVLLILVVATTCHEPFQVIFQWNTIEVVWPTEEERQFALDHNDYVQANNFIAGIKFWKGKMYLTVPRWKNGVPVTLGVTSATPVNRVTNPKLEAFPNWEMQKIDDCSALQFVQSMEIDPLGRMWVPDSGKMSPLSIETKTTCPPKLVILNLEKNGEVLRTYEFPPHVARHGTAHLNDIVLDHEDGGMAYITDSDREDPGIIVYSLRNNTSWKVRHDSMKAKPEAVSFMISKTPINTPIAVDGIALSPASVSERQVYYSPLSSFHLYSIPTSVLKTNMTNVDEHVNELGRKNSQTDGMMMSAKGVLYFGLLADDAVAMWDTKQSSSFATGQRVISRDHERMQWPDTFAFDEDGNFYCVTNSLQNILNNRVNASVPNYRVVRARTGVKSYQYLEDGSAPEQPEIPTSVANRISFAMATGLAILLAYAAQ
ncbi:dopaminechrome tautomerase [Megachile rotundata]|uniref:dopaminechrome tautomerase n=1 Tax=Megachile rotundata TaxID=143995 RepID=UPI000258F7E5|nr:PREDICTED: major royal jelly protein 1 [Megachile rotundata]